MKKLFKKEFPGVVAQVSFPISHNPLKGKSLFEEGYKYNVVVYRCVQSIIKAIQPIKVRIKDGDNYLDSGKTYDLIAELLKKPNPSQYMSSFLEEGFINRLILGETFHVLSDDSQKIPTEIWNLNPLEIEIIQGKRMPSAYRQTLNGSSKQWDVDQITGDSQVFYWKGTNPTDFYRGMSPLHAACLSADTNNAGLKWNFSLLKKGGRLTGLIKYKGQGPDEQGMSRLKKWFKATLQGEYNAGEVGILTGDAEFQEMGTNPKDMDYIKTIDKTTSFIAMAYGVPLPLVLNDAATFNNYREAKESFYTETVIPLYKDYLQCLGGWLLPRFGLKGAILEIDEDSIQAVEPIRERRNERLTKLVSSGIISPDEAREELGYEVRGGMADDLYMSSSMIPIQESGVVDD
jgi:HK97 family phage portal protein